MYVINILGSLWYSHKFYSLPVMRENNFEELCEYSNPKERQKSIENVSSLLTKTKAVFSTYLLSNIHTSIRKDIIFLCHSLTASEFLTSYWGATHHAKICCKCSVLPSLLECSSSCSRSIGISIACFRCRWWNSTPITWRSPDGGGRAGTLSSVASDLTQLTALR